MQWPLPIVDMVLVLVQFTWAMLDAGAMKVVSLNAHIAHQSPVPIGVGVLE